MQLWVRFPDLPNIEISTSTLDTPEMPPVWGENVYVVRRRVETRDFDVC